MTVIKKAVCILMTATLAFGSLAGCGKNTKGAVNTKYEKDENLNEVGAFPVCKEKITLRVGIPKNEFITDYDDNTFTKKLEEMMNCDIEFEFLPSSDTMQKVELMMNSGGDELPDIICGVNFTDGALAGYGDAGMIIPLNAYYENSAYYINDAFEKEKD